MVPNKGSSTAEDGEGVPVELQATINGANRTAIATNNHNFIPAIFATPIEIILPLREADIKLRIGPINVRDINP